MQETTAKEFRRHLGREVDRAVEEHRPLRVRRRKGGDFVVLGVDDWRAIEETLYLNRVPGLADSIRSAAEEPLEDGVALES